jgi:hypothetical protein
MALQIENGKIIELEAIDANKYKIEVYSDSLLDISYSES